MRLYVNLLLPVLLLLSACLHSQNESGAISLPGDRFFDNGLSLRGNDSADPFTGKMLYPFGKKNREPVWLLAEWGSKHLLNQSDFAEENGTKIFENEGKLIAFKRTENDMNIRMEVRASAEYQRPRAFNEFWSHLLIEQEFIEKPLVDSIGKLLLHFEGKLLYCQSFMDDETFNPGLHTAQFQLFLTIQDRNPSSPKYGDYLWFGVPFYDFRYPEISRYAAQDIAKDDATGKFIYSLGTNDYTEKSFHGGEWIAVEMDLKPHILEALATAKERGYLTESKAEDFRITGMNLGWEVPGTFDAAFEFRSFNLSWIPADGG